MTSRPERWTAKGQKNMEGVNMPASQKSAWRWIVATTAAAMLFMAALPSVGHADTLTICINNKGRIKGINVSCPGTSLTWETVGPQGAQGPDGVDGPPGFAGAQGTAGPPGIQGTNGAQGLTGPTGDPGVQGDTGAKGVAGIQGNPGLTGPPGAVGPKGTGPGGNQTNKTFLTGGTLGTFGFNEKIALSGAFLTGNRLTLGPGNGADSSGHSEVPMNDTGIAYNLFVHTDKNPGTVPSGPDKGTPMSYTFLLCNTNAGGTSCTVTCTIIDPDTTCQDTHVLGVGDSLSFFSSDLMGLQAWSSNAAANSANVTWSVTYDHAPIAAP